MPFSPSSINSSHNSWNICVLSDSQVAIKALNSLHINSKLVWDCHQSWCNWQNITRLNWCACCDNGDWWEWNRWFSILARLLTSAYKELSLLLTYLQRLLRGWSGPRWAGNTSVGCPFVDRGRL